jgi:hypothetical protein
MHRIIRDSLEKYLNGSPSEIPAEFHAHLGECGECYSELGLLETQSQILRSLRNPDIEPSAGFYARVMERIEAQPASIWSVLLERRFGFRLALASAALVALLGTYLVTSEPSGPEQASAPAIVRTDTPPATEANVEPEPSGQQRDAVLVDLASYHQ